MNLVDANKDDGIGINFRPQNVTLPLSGVKFGELEILAEADALKELIYFNELDSDRNFRRLFRNNI